MALENRPKTLRRWLLFDLHSKERGGNSAKSAVGTWKWVLRGLETLLGQIGAILGMYSEFQDAWTRSKVGEWRFLTKINDAKVTIISDARWRWTTMECLKDKWQENAPCFKGNWITSEQEYKRTNEWMKLKEKVWKKETRWISDQLFRTRTSP